eukprot:8139620-Pyramimonas_sp.AAC.1
MPAGPFARAALEEQEPQDAVSPCVRVTSAMVAERGSAVNCADQTHGTTEDACCPWQRRPESSWWIAEVTSSCQSSVAEMRTGPAGPSKPARSSR